MRKSVRRTEPLSNPPIGSHFHPSTHSGSRRPALYADAPAADAPKTEVPPEGTPFFGSSPYLTGVGGIFGRFFLVTRWRPSAARVIPRDESLVRRDWSGAAAAQDSGSASQPEQNDAGGFGHRGTGDSEGLNLTGAQWAVPEGDGGNIERQVFVTLVGE